jgi:hypothetical protein
VRIIVVWDSLATLPARRKWWHCGRAMPPPRGTWWCARRTQRHQFLCHIT